MSLIGTLEKSARSSSLSKITSRPVLDFLYPNLMGKELGSKRQCGKSRETRSPYAGVETVFIQALARAGSCQQHAVDHPLRLRTSRPCATTQKHGLKITSIPKNARRHFRTDARTHNASEAVAQLLEEAYRTEVVHKMDLRTVDKRHIPDMAISIAARFPIDQIDHTDIRKMMHWCDRQVYGFVDAHNKTRYRLAVELQDRLAEMAAPNAPSPPVEAQPQPDITKQDLYELIPPRLRVSWDDDSRKDKDVITEKEKVRYEEDVVVPRPVTADPEKMKQMNTNEILDEILWLLEDQHSRPEDVFALYTNLPEPRPRHFGEVSLRKLLSFLAFVEKPDIPSMERYFYVLDDISAANIKIGTRHWNWAIRFAGLSMKRVTNTEMDAAMYLWKEMEKQGLESDVITFNVLLTIAMRSGNLHLGQSIMEEMKNRDVGITRYHSTSLILYHGHMKDSVGVRKAYKKLVDGGFIVDTTVLNCVISSLMRANEPYAAEQVFERMKELHRTKTDAIDVKFDWRTRRQLAFEVSSIESKDDEEKMKAISKLASIEPDMTTYRLLIGYHATKSGNINRVIDMLGELGEISRTPDGAVFQYLFRGFLKFGGIPYSTWTKDQLEVIWEALKVALDGNVDTVWLEDALVITILNAFGQCSTHIRVLEIWEEIMERWKPSESEKRDALTTLNKICPR